MTEAFYVLQDRFSGAYLTLEYSCRGEEIWSLIECILCASRFTRQAALLRVAEGSFDKFSDFEDYDVEAVYLDILDERQVPLPIVGGHIDHLRAIQRR